MSNAPRPLGDTGSSHLAVYEVNVVLLRDRASGGRASADHVAVDLQRAEWISQVWEKKASATETDRRSHVGYRSTRENIGVLALAEDDYAFGL
jgi:hypothetical protein